MKANRPCEREACTSVVDPKLFIYKNSDPDPALTLISDPDKDSDPDCL